MSVITAHWWREGGFRVHRSGREKREGGSDRTAKRERERDREMENKKKQEQVLKRPSNEEPREIARN